jgi:hypothetical protein
MPTRKYEYLHGLACALKLGFYCRSSKTSQSDARHRESRVELRTTRSGVAVEAAINELA